jgi:cytochrome c oxidase cbb3-type subunit 2
MTTTRLLASLTALFLGLTASGARAEPPDAATAARGAKAYGKYCISCHGTHGDGRGPSAEWVDPRPRNFTTGTFKFRSTASGELPTDADLERTIEHGLNHTNMPHWRALTAVERRDLVQFIKTFSARFATEPQGKPIAVPPAPPVTPALVAKGKEVWNKMQCASCHGDGGKGDGSSASTLRDDWGYPITPRDFTRGPLKVGDRPEDLYRTFLTGLNGSPMPSFAEAGMTPDEAWALVAYVRSLRKD